MSKRIPPALAYAGSVAFEKGLSIITIPLMARFIPPAEYGRFDVAVSLAEFIGLILALGLPHTLIRFASTAEDNEAQKRCSAELLGTGLALTLVLGLVVQLLTPAFMHMLQLEVSSFPMHMLLAAAATFALIEMPLVWLRLQGQAELFMYFTVSRTAIQVTLMWLVLFLGYGIDGVMISNSLVQILFATFLVVRQARISGILVNSRSLQRIRDYGLPLVGAALAMFAVGNANRLFLTGNVSDAEIAHFGIASRLALATFLVYYPFELWWNPQRIKVLMEDDGLERSAASWRLGFSILLFSALGVALAGPLFVDLVLPESYAGAVPLIPLLVLVQVIHQTGSLSNVGTYARENGGYVFAIDAASAVLTVVSYMLLVPRFGVYGAVAGMGAGFSLRMILHLGFGWKMAPIPYPALTAIFLLLVSMALVAAAPNQSSIPIRIGWSVLALGVIAYLLHRTRMFWLPEHIRGQLMAMIRPARSQ